MSTQEPSGSEASEPIEITPEVAAPSGAEANAEDQSTAVEAGARKSPSLLDAPATYGLLFVNILFFCVTVKASLLVPGDFAWLWHHHHYGALLTLPFPTQVLTWFGGCEVSKVLVEHQWIRLVTATFMHLNFLHLAINMWCLWNLGLLGEPLLGRRGLVAVYVLTGIAGNLCSLAFDSFRHLQHGLVVGASGAIFGIAGILIVLLSNRKLSLPWEELRSLRRSVIWFAVLNLLMGILPQVLLGMLPHKTIVRLPGEVEMLTHVSNMAHLGGFFCGLLMGLPLFPRMLVGRAGYRQRQRVTFACTAFGLCLFAYAILQFHGGK